MDDTLDILGRTIAEALAPAVSASSSGFAPISFEIARRTRFGPSKYSTSGTRYGNFLDSMAFCMALMATFGTGLCPAKLR